MRWTLKADKETESFKRRAKKLISQISTLFSLNERKQIADLLESKIKIDLDLEIFKRLEEHGLINAYQELIGSIPKQSWTLVESASIDFFKYCRREKKYYSTEAPTDNNSYFDIAEMLECFDPIELEKWLDRKCSWAKTQDIEGIISNYSYFGEERRSEVNILNKGRSLIESGLHLEALNLDVDRLHLDIQSEVWNVISLLTKYRFQSLADFYPRLMDPYARFLIKISLSRRHDRLKIGVSYIASNNPSLVWLGAELCADGLKEIEELYASSDLSMHKRKDEIIQRRVDFIQKANLALWEKIFATGQVSTLKELELALEVFNIERASMSGYKIQVLEVVRFQSFLDATLSFLKKNPDLIHGLPMMYSSHFSVLELYWLGEYLAGKEESLTEEMIQRMNNFFSFFISRIEDKDQRYTFHVGSNYDLRKVNGWIAFFSGLLKHKKWKDVWLPIKKSIKRITQMEMSIWKSVEYQHAVDDVITYSLTILIYACKYRGLCNSLTLQEFMNIFQGVEISPYSSRPNWEVFLKSIEPFQCSGPVRIFIEKVILGDGVSPDIISLLPREILKENPAWLERAKIQVVSYKEYFDKEFEASKERLILKDII